MTFTLISVVYACGVAKPGHGSFTPLVVGLSLVACAGTGAHLTARTWMAKCRPCGCELTCLSPAVLSWTALLPHYSRV
jgi:glycerol uptake facilitator-like aquaporin